MSEHDPALIDRAFQIADDAMSQLLLSEGVIGDEARTVVAFTNEVSQTSASWPSRPRRCRTRSTG
jgi:hypothetical protein